MPDPKAPVAVTPPPQAYTILKTDRQMSITRFSPCGKMLVAAGRDGTIRRWDITPAEKGAEKSAEVDPLATAADTKNKKPAKAPPPPELPELTPLKSHNGWVTSLAFHKDQKRLFSADSWGRVNCWEYAEKDPQPLWKIDPAVDGWIRQIALSPDGNTLATCGVDQKVCFWSTVDGTKTGELIGHNQDIFSITYHPDGKSLVSGDFMGVVKHWDLATGKAVRDFDASVFHKLDRLQDVGGVRTMVFDPEGKTLACGGIKPDGGGFVQGTPTLLFIDWESGKATAPPLALATNKEGYVHDMLYHRDGYYIGACAGQPGNGLFFLLRPKETSPFYTGKLGNCHSVDVHPNGYRLAVLSNAGTFGQGPSKAKQGDYPGNSSPVNLWDLPRPTASA